MSNINHPLIAPLIEELNQLRGNPDLRDRYRYIHMRHEKWGDQDQNEKARERIVLALAHDHSKHDETLIRFLFEEEVTAREKDSFQGVGDTLERLSTLMIPHKTDADFETFLAAKMANFDTFLGYDIEFVIAGYGLPKAYAMAKASQSEHAATYLEREDVKPDTSNLTEAHIAKFIERNKRHLSPPIETPEDEIFVAATLERFDYAQDKLAEMKAQTKAWTKETLTTYRYRARTAESPEEELWAVEHLLPFMTDNWDRASLLRDLAQFQFKNAEFEASWENVYTAVNLLKARDGEDWANVNLARFLIEIGFDLANEARTPNTLRKTAYDWSIGELNALDAEALNNIYWNLLRKAIQAANAFEDSANAEKFEAELERQRSASVC